MIDIKAEAKKLIKPTITLGILILILWLVPNKDVFTVTSIVLLVFTAADLITKPMSEILSKRYLKSRVILILIIVGLYYLNAWLGKYGWIGLVVIVLLLVAYRLIASRKKYVDSMRTIETQMFGKPLEKKYWREENEK